MRTATLVKSEKAKIIVVIIFVEGHFRCWFADVTPIFPSFSGTRNRQVIIAVGFYGCCFGIGSFM